MPQEKLLPNAPMIQKRAQRGRGSITWRPSPFGQRVSRAMSICNSRASERQVARLMSWYEPSLVYDSSLFSVLWFLLGLPQFQLSFPSHYDVFVQLFFSSYSCHVTTSIPFQLRSLARSPCCDRARL